MFGDFAQPKVSRRLSVSNIKRLGPCSCGLAALLCPCGFKVDADGSTPVAKLPQEQ